MAEANAFAKHMTFNRFKYIVCERFSWNIILQSFIFEIGPLANRKKHKYISRK
jgi:hypothetical protein